MGQQSLCLCVYKKSERWWQIWHSLWTHRTLGLLQVSINRAVKEEAHGAGGACGERVKGVHAEGTALAKARRQHHGFEELKDMQWLKRTVAPAQGERKTGQILRGP